MIDRWYRWVDDRMWERQTDIHGKISQCISKCLIKTFNFQKQTAVPWNWSHKINSILICLSVSFNLCRLSLALHQGFSILAWLPFGARPFPPGDHPVPYDIVNSISCPHPLDPSSIPPPRGDNSRHGQVSPRGQNFPLQTPTPSFPGLLWISVYYYGRDNFKCQLA